MMIKNNRKIIKQILTLLLICPISSWAQTYLVDFSRAQLPSDSLTWLNMSSGVATDVALIEEGSGTADPSAKISHNLSGDSNSTGWSGGDVGWVLSNAGNDGFYSGATGTITFSGLNNNYTYSVEVVSAESSAAGNFPSTADIQVGGAFADSNHLGTVANGDNWITDSDGLGNWLIWNGVSPAMGEIVVTINSVNPGTYSTINAIRLNVVTTPVELMSFEIE